VAQRGGGQAAPPRDGRGSVRSFSPSFLFLFFLCLCVRLLCGFMPAVLLEIISPVTIIIILLYHLRLMLLF
jgi:hypothetical protein